MSPRDVKFMQWFLIVGWGGLLQSLEPFLIILTKLGGRIATGIEQAEGCCYTFCSAQDRTVWPLKSIVLISRAHHYQGLFSNEVSVLILVFLLIWS